MNVAIFTLLGVVAAVCAFIAIRAARSCNAALNEATKLLTQLSNERGTLAALSSEFAALGTAFGKLSGRVAAVKRWDQENHGQAKAAEAKTIDSERFAAPSAHSDAAAKAAWKAMMRERHLVKPNR